MTNLRFSQLETHINIDEIIPISFRNHFYERASRTCKLHFYRTRIEPINTQKNRKPSKIKDLRLLNFKKLFLSHPIFPVFFEVIFLQFLQKSSTNECRFWSFTSECQRFLCVLRYLLIRIFPRFFHLFSCQFHRIYRTT